MTTAAKKKTRAEFDEAFDKAAEIALNADESDVKIHISLRLDMDIYRELKRRANAGEADGKYQVLLNRILRKHLMGKTIARIESSSIDKESVVKMLKFLIEDQQRSEKRDQYLKRHQLKSRPVETSIRGRAMSPGIMARKAVAKSTKKKSA